MHPDSLFAAAAGADIVFHDALARDSLDIMQNVMAESGRSGIAQIIADVTDYHADTRVLEEAATCSRYRATGALSSGTHANELSH